MCVCVCVCVCVWDNQVELFCDCIRRCSPFKVSVGAHDMQYIIINGPVVIGWKYV